MKRKLCQGGALRLGARAHAPDATMELKEGNCERPVKIAIVILPLHPAFGDILAKKTASSGPLAKSGPLRPGKSLPLGWHIDYVLRTVNLQRRLTSRA
jgi:hypothetical protein